MTEWYKQDNLDIHAKSTHITKSHKRSHKPKLGKECAFPNAEKNSIFFLPPLWKN
jgi:hypothetical protein